MKSPVSWLSDAEYDRAAIQEKALAVADSLVGVKEIGVNRGPWVRRFLARVGLGAGYPWCAAFVSYCLTEAGYTGGPEKGRAAVRNWAAWSKKSHKRLQPGERPKRGDLFYYLNKDGTGHIGFVLGEMPSKINTLRTLEGNTNVNNSREGDGVYKRERFAVGMNFIRWWE